MTQQLDLKALSLKDELDNDEIDRLFKLKTSGLF